MPQVRNFLRHTEGDANAVVNDAYTHYIKTVRITKVLHPDNPNVVVVIESNLSGNKITGTTYQHGFELRYDHPLRSFMFGPSQDVKVFTNDKMAAEKRLPSWVERAIQDHIRQFYA